MRGLEGSAYVELLRQLSLIGAHAHIEVPAIVVCGDQSAGKSSLIQRICGVPLPRSDGTCTRCPMEVMLIASARWSCTCRIRREYDDQNNKKLDQVREETFGNVLTDPEGVELAIRRAQKAVLNPGKPARDFLTYNFELNPKEEAASNERQFSRNLVVLEVRGMPYNLTLIDLPGIINSTERQEDKILIDLIRDLVLSYISKPQSIIVATISCKNDVNNQMVFKLADEVHEGNQRTLGVLTKVDQIERGCHDGWLAIMRGEDFKLDPLGYFMVRNPTKVELDEHIGAEEAARREETFFQESVALKPLRDKVDLSLRLGVPNLIKMLSDILVLKVKQQLPGMKQSVDEQLKSTRAELAGLPPAVQEKDRADVLQQALRSLDQDARLLLNAQGCLSSKHFVQRWQALYEGMASNVFSTRPRFILFEERARGTVEAPYDDSKDSDADDGKIIGAPAASTTQKASPSTSTPAPAPAFEFGDRGNSTPTASLPAPGLSSLLPASSNPFANPAAPAPAPAPTFGAAPASSNPFTSLAAAVTSSTPAASAAAPAPAPAPAPPPTFTFGGRSASNPPKPTSPATSPAPVPTGKVPTKLTIDEVKDIVAKERSYELPKFTPYTALQSVIQHFQGMWNEHAFQCLDKSAELLKAELNIIVGKHFGRFRDSRLESIVRLCVEDAVEQQYTETRKQIMLLIEMESTERQPPFTLNKHYFEDSYSKILDRMKALLCKNQMQGVDKQALKQSVADALSALSRIPGFQGMTQEQLLALQPRNQDNGEELPIMAATMSYFKVSSKRYVDYVALSITRLLYVRVAESIEGHVDRYLKRLSARAAAGNREPANPLVLMEGGQADVGASRQWQDSEAVLSLVADDPKIAKLRGSLQAKLESLQATRSVLSRFA